MSHKSAVEELRQRSKTLQEELSGFPSDGLGVKEAEMHEFQPMQSQALVETGSTRNGETDQEIFARLAAKAEEMTDDEGDGDDLEEEDDVETGGTGGGFQIKTRPNAGGPAEEVEFGLYGKNFFGVNLKASSFVIDVVMVLKWVDKRVASLIPEGLDGLTLSKKESELKMWLPGMVITNRDIGKYDLISTAVFIKKSGEVLKVERATAIVKTKYYLENFPFDRQDLVVKIASHKYMLNDVVLKPAKEGTGVRKGLFDGESYDFVSVGSSAIKDVNGALKKSRGLLTITVDRNLDKYTQSHLIPSFLVTMISWGVFWFPFVAPFITPRLAMSVLSLLTFTNLTLKSAAALPPGAPFNWNDVLNRTIMTMMFCTVCLNILSEKCFHHMKIDDVAKSINNECKVLIPGVTVISLILVLSACGQKGWMSLHTTSSVVNCLIGLVIGSYMAFTTTRIMSALAKKKLEEAAKAEGAK